MILADYFDLAVPFLASSSPVWVAWGISSVASGIISLYLSRRGSGAARAIALMILIGATVLSASAAVTPASTVSLPMLLGMIIVTGLVGAAAWLQLSNSDQLFLIPTGQAAALFLISILSPLLAIELGAAASSLPWIKTVTGTLRLSAPGFVQGERAGFYSYTIALFALLATGPLWLPIVLRGSREPSHIERTQTSARRTSILGPSQYGLLLVAAVVMSFIISSYRISLGYPLTGDANYYISVLEEMDRYGVKAAIQTDRPVLFLILYSLSRCFLIGAEPLLKQLQIVLAGALVIVTFSFVKSYFMDGRLAILSAFLASAGPHLTIGINYLILGNWLALILMMTFYTAMAKSIADRSRAWLISTAAISWLLLGVHFPTWAFTMLVLIAYTLTCWLQRSPLQDPEAAAHSIKVAIGSLSALLPLLILSLTTPQVSASVKCAWSKAITILSQATPLNLLSFLHDEILLTSYFAYGGYAVPLTYALALLGLYRLYLIRKPRIGLVLSWATVTSLGLLLIPKPEQWRLLYMVPLEILAALGLTHALASAGLLKPMSPAHTENTRWLQGPALIFSLVIGGALLVTNIAPPLAVISALPLVGLLLAYGVSHDQIRQIAASLIVLLYVLVEFAAAISTLG
mgnify:CR=1 FL=1